MNISIIKHISIASLLFILVACGNDIEENSKAKNPEPLREEPIQTNEQSSETDRIELLIAINSNDTLIVEQSIDKFPDLNFHFANGETPLTYALKKSKNEIISIIANKRQSLNKANQQGLTPLNIAIQRNKIYIIEKLLSFDLSLHTANIHGKYPLDYALDNTTEKTLLRLIHLGAITTDDKFYDKLINKGYQQAAKLYKFTLTLDDRNDHTADDLIMAIKSEGTENIKYILGGLNTKIIINSENFLFEAQNIENQSTRIKVVELLLKNNVDPNTEDIMSPLVQAIILGLSDKEVLTLLKYGADVTILDSNKRLPISYAVEIGNTSLVNILIEDAQQRLSNDEMLLHNKHGCYYLPSKVQIRKSKNLKTRNIKAINNSLECGIKVRRNRSRSRLRH